jgi:chitinase
LGAYEALLLAVGDAAVMEGNTGSSVAVFIVTVGSAVPGPQTVTATYSITGGTATAGVDFLAASGTLVIAAGQQSTVITATVLGDILDEDVETFIVSLGNPTHALLGDAQAIGSIIDDDPLGVLYVPVLMHNSP